MLAPDLDLSLLPPTARDLVDLVGLAPTLRLVEALGGRSFQVAHGKRRQGRAQLAELADIVGADAAKGIARRYAGGVLVVPLCTAALRAARDRALQARFDMLTGEGELSARRAVAQLVGEFQMHETTVWRALKRPGLVTPADDAQGDLFAMATPCARA